MRGGAPPCPVRFGFCQCGLLQVGRPFHGDRVRIIGAALAEGERCAHETFYERRARGGRVPPPAARRPPDARAS